jgi:hypothetical protein
MSESRMDKAKPQPPPPTINTGTSISPACILPPPEFVAACRAGLAPLAVAESSMPMRAPADGFDRIDFARQPSGSAAPEMESA